MVPAWPVSPYWSIAAMIGATCRWCPLPLRLTTNILEGTISARQNCQTEQFPPVAHSPEKPRLPRGAFLSSLFPRIGRYRCAGDLRPGFSAAPPSEHTPLGPAPRRLSFGGISTSAHASLASVNGCALRRAGRGRRVTRQNKNAPGRNNRTRCGAGKYLRVWKLPVLLPTLPYFSKTQSR